MPEPIEDTAMEDVIPSVEMEHNEEIHNNVGIDYRKRDDVGIGYQKREYIPITEWDSGNAAELADW